MRTRVELSVETAPETKAWASGVRLADQKAFREIVSLGFEALDYGGEYEYQLVRIELSPDDGRLRKVFDILWTAGMSVYERRVAPPGLICTHFTPRRFRNYEERDLTSCKYLSIQRSMNPRDWQKGYIASSWCFHEPVLHIANDRSQRSKLLFGVSDKHVIVSQRFRQAMEEIGVKDVFYAPVDLV